jgi:hypothetical protein
MMTIEGWIDDVENGRIYGRLLDDGNELEFDMALTDALECQSALDRALDGLTARFVSGNFCIEI